MGSVLLSTIDPLEFYFMAPIFGFLLLGLTTLNANAAEPRFAARIVPVTRPVIAGLSWKKKEPDLLVRGKGAKRKIYALLRGRYTGGGELIHRNWSIPLSPKGDFAFRVRLASKETPVKFIVRDEAGKERVQKFVINLSKIPSLPRRKVVEVTTPPETTQAAPVADEAVRIEPRNTPTVQVERTEPAPQPSITTYALLGSQLYLYDELNFYNFKQYAALAIFRYEEPFSEKWIFRGTAGLATYAFERNSPTWSLSHISLEAVAGYRLNRVTSSWRPRWNVGVLYSTLITSGKEFGYTSLFRPRLFPSLGRDIGKRVSVDASAWYMPLGAVTGLGRERELGARLRMDYRLSGGDAIALDVEVAELRIYLSDLAWSQSKIVQVAIGYGW